MCVPSEANGQIIKHPLPPYMADEGVCVQNGIIIDKEDLHTASEGSEGILVKGCHGPLLQQPLHIFLALVYFLLIDNVLFIGFKNIISVQGIQLNTKVWMNC